jgi:hypothetical protein
MLAGPSGSGKSTFAATHFLPTEVLSSDESRARVADDATAQHVTEDAFALLHFTPRPALEAPPVYRGRLHGVKTVRAGTDIWKRRRSGTRRSTR